MKTRIEVFRRDNPQNVVASGEWNRILSADEIRKALKDLYRWIDRPKYDHRIIKTQ